MEPFTLNIGVTGHRELADPAGVRAAVDRLLGHVRETLERAGAEPMSGAASRWTPMKVVDAALAHGLKCVVWNLPLTPWRVDESRRLPVAWRVTSGLAKGSDRIVADAVLVMPRSRLRALLPLAPEEYEQDFPEGLDREEFHRLLNRAQADGEIIVATPAQATGRTTPNTAHHAFGASHEGGTGRGAASESAGDIPTESSGGVTHARSLGRADASVDESPSVVGDARARAYQAAGRAMVDTCDLLIAVWDGEPGRGAGGTADTIAYAVDKGVPVYWINAANPDTPVKLITGKSEDGSGYVTTKLPRTAREIAPRYHPIAAFYRDPALDEAKYRANLERSREELKELIAAAGISGAEVDAYIERRVALYEYANQLALQHQKYRNRSAVTLFVVAALAVSCAALQLIVFPAQHWLVAIEIGLMVFAAVLLRVSRREAWHEKWLYDRHLAERLRSLIFCEIVQRAAHDDKVPERSSAQLYEVSAAWVEDLIRTETRNAPPPKVNNADLEKLRDFVSAGWLQSQSNWHKGTAEKKERKGRLLHYGASLLFLLTLICAALHLADVGHHTEVAGIPIGAFIGFLAVSLPAWGGALHGISHLFDYGKLAHRSRRMAALLSELAAKVNAAGSLEELCHACREAEDLTRTENADWVISLTHRGLVLPV